MFGNSHLILPNGKSSRICVLRSIEPPENRWMYVPADYLRVAGFVNVDTVDIDRRTYERQLSDVLNKKYDLIFNICDALVMDVKAGFEVCYYLNTKCIVPFVSPSIRDYNISREEMKKACLLNGIRTPKHAFVYNLSADRSKLDEMKFPLIVKHFNSSDSWDLTKESRVANKEELDVQLKRMIDRNHGALVEEFIEGREFTCLLADNADDLDDPIVYEPVEFLFLNEGDTFKYQFLKFDNYKAMTTARVSDPIVVL